MSTECRHAVRRYYRLQTKVEEDIKEAQTDFDAPRLAKLQELQLRCFPSKEQVIEWVEAFYREEA